MTVRVAHGLVAAIYAATTIAVLILATNVYFSTITLPNFDVYTPLAAALVAVAFFAGFFERRVKARSSVLATICGFVLGFLVTAAWMNGTSLLAPFIGGFALGALAGIAGLLTQGLESKAIMDRD